MKYRTKTSRIEAVRLKNPIQVLNFPGDSWAMGRKGDWLVIYEDGRQVLMDDEDFRREYEPDTTPAPVYPGLGGTRTLPYITPPVLPNRPMFGDGPPVVYCTAPSLGEMK